MATKFISAVTDDAMQKICYEGGGWELTPIKYIISSKDVLSGIIEKDDDGNILNEDECLKALCKLSTDDVNNDENDNKWYDSNFSSIIKASATSLNHHVVIPPDAVNPTETRTLKTIYFMYQPKIDETPFLYGVAYAVSDIECEYGITQSFYFTFTVSNARYFDGTSFVVNYTYPQTIEDHNRDLSTDVHQVFVRRDNKAKPTELLEYDNNLISRLPRVGNTAQDIKDISDYAILPKSAIKTLFEKFVEKNTGLQLPDDNNW